MPIRKISPESACLQCPLEMFAFESTDEIHEVARIVGQDRALEAVEFGIGIEHKGFNLFVIAPGDRTPHRHPLVHRPEGADPPGAPRLVLRQQLPSVPQAPGFDFPQGESLVFKKEMHDLIDMLRVTLSTVFEGDDFKSRIKAVNEEFKRKVDRLYHQIEEQAKRESIAVVKSDQGIMVAPIDGAGNILDTESFRKLPETIRQRIDELIEKYQNVLQDGMQQITQMKRETEGEKGKIKEDLARQVVSTLTSTLKMKYQSRAALNQYLQDVEDDIIEHVDDFLYRAEEGRENFVNLMTAHAPSFDRYEVNILVANDSSSAPVVYEDLPTYQNLHGRIENVAKMGMLSTHFTLIKPGSLHMANGGYIIIDARRLLMQFVCRRGA